TLLEEKRKCAEAHPGTLRTSPGVSVGAGGCAERMDRRLDRRERPGVFRDPVLEPGTIHGTLHHSLGPQRRDGRGAGAARGVEPVNGFIGVPDGNTLFREHRSRGRFPHSYGTGEPEKEGPAHSARTAARSASSTSGRTPNQRSKAGAA